MQWQILLESIDYYTYSKEDEKIHFANGDGKVTAENSYKYIVSTYELYKNPDDHWAFDIALDCVRTMSAKDREFISQHTDTSLYHFGYAMEIRNNFLYGEYGTKHHFVVSADDLSSRIMEMIFAILCPDYVLE